MKFQSLIEYCRSLPHTVEDVKWGNDVVFSILGGKMFCIFSLENKNCTSMSFKVDDHRFLEMTDRPEFIPAPYLARARWVSLVNPEGVPTRELRQLIHRSHQLNFEKLPKYRQRELPGAQNR